MLSMAETDRVRRSRLLARFWASALGFWSPQRGGKFAWILSGGLLVLIVLQLAFQYGINLWNRSLFDAVERKDSSAVMQLTIIFFPLVSGALLFGVTQVAVRMRIQRSWRAWLAKVVTDRWLTNGHYYQLNLTKGHHQNPEYRITDDLRVATDAPVDFVAGIISAFLSATTFIIVLWTIGGSISLTVFGTTITIHGFLVVAALVYALCASTATFAIGRSFVTIAEGKNQAEAEYRYALMRVRENAESIALLGGEEEERAGIDRSFGTVIRQWSMLAGQHVRATIVSQGSTLIVPIVPLLLCAPKYLDGSMTLGQMMQAASAFTFVQSAFGWLVDNYPRLADWNANASRIASLVVSLDHLERVEAGAGVNRIERGESADATAVCLDNLSITLDDGTTVLDRSRVSIKTGERVLVEGESGVGKSTLVRAIAGLWPWGSGRVDLSAGQRLFLLPQKPYLPSGTLRRAAAYPSPDNRWSASQIADMLEKVGLGHIKNRIDENEPWDQILSGGEKQRLSFARLILHRPDIVVLDEATSALDIRGQEEVMTLLQTEMAGATIISVAHRAELGVFHDRKLRIERMGGSSSRFGESALAAI